MKWVPRRLTGPVVVAVLLAAAAPARGLIGAEEVSEAAARLEEAQAEAGETASALAAARADQERLYGRLEALVAEVAAAQSRLAASRVAARESARSLYVSAGCLPPAGAALDGGEGASVRAAYAEAVGREGRSAINALALAERDLQERRRVVREEAAAQQGLTRRLEELAAAAGPALASAEADYARALALWQEQEARRGVEAASSSATAPATTTTLPATTTSPTTTTSTTTTTTLPPVTGGAFPPLVERWRPVVAGYFAPELVDEALAVIGCESGGDPAIVNRTSGAAGLFQHLPEYWAERAAAAGFPGYPSSDGEANIAAAAWLAGESMAAGLGAWYFWACRP